jgi:hypothetical protein
MTAAAALPLNKLRAWEGNVIAQTAMPASRNWHPRLPRRLLQSVVVRKDRKGLYAVVAGRRRFLALKSLVRDGKINDDHDIQCHVIASEANATEISLAENAVRMQMHPAHIAARFGVTESVVQQRLRLARSAPSFWKPRRDVLVEQRWAAGGVNDYGAHVFQYIECQQHLCHEPYEKGNACCSDDSEAAPAWAQHTLGKQSESRSTLKRLSEVTTSQFQRRTILLLGREDCLSKVNRYATGTLRAAAMRSIFSKDGAFLPRSIKLRKSTDIPIISAKSS